MLLGTNVQDRGVVAQSAAVSQAAVDIQLPTVFGRYLLVQRVSRGGMGEIFLAKHGLAGFEKLAVIKKVLPNLAQDTQFISRFVDEAQVAIKLHHVNIAQVFEVGQVGDEYFLALEYIEGRDLRRLFALLAQRGQRLPIDLALFIARELANGLAYAHRRTSRDGASLNLVHCDISPPNVVVSFEGEIKIIDFGIAKSALRGTATDPKMGFGKFGYMAPEQLVRGGVIDHRTDIYAAGVVLFELLTGRRLYEATDNPDYRALARAVSKGEHALPSEIDPALARFDDIVATALAPRASDRFATAAELRDAIAAALSVENPTISTDQLGMFMRGIFADDIAKQREVHERIAATHLDDFREALHTQSLHTISFASSELAMGGKRARASAEYQAAATDGAPANRPLSAPATAEASAPPSAQRAHALSRARTRAILLGAALALVVGGAVFAATKALVPQRATVADRVTPPTQGPSVTPLPTVSPLPDANQGSAAPVLAPQDPATVRETSAGPNAPALTTSDRPRGRIDRKSPERQVTREQVGAKFSAASREYDSFKAKFGQRLERQWTDLATYIQYQTKPETFDAALRKVEAFRAEMRRTQP